LNAPAPAQLSLLDDVAPPDELRGLERLGATVEFGSLLLNLLEMDGWDVQRVGAFAGEGVLVIARRGPFEVRRTGESIGEISTEVFKECAALRGAL